MTNRLGLATRRWLAVATVGAVLAACENDPVQPELVGTWQAAIASSAGAVQLRFTTLSNGQYRIEYMGPAAMPEETGYFAAEDGEWRRERIAGGIEQGTYEFLSDDSVLFQDAASAAVVWTRVTDSVPRPGVTPAAGGAPPAPAAASSDILSAGPFGPPLNSSAAASVTPSGMPVAPAPFGVPNTSGAPLFAPPPELVAMPGTSGTAPASGSGAIPTQTVQSAIATGTNAIADLDTRALADLPEQTLNDLEASTRQAATGAVDEAAAEAERKIGQRIQNVTTNVGSRVRGFFTRDRNRDEDDDEQ